MTKAFVSVCALLVLCSVAQAGPSVEARREVGISQAHNYWLSDGLNRLVFWQPMAAHKRPESRAQ